MSADAWTTGPVAGRICPTCAGERPGGFVVDDIDDRARVGSPEDAAIILVPELATSDRERCVVAVLDTKHRMLRLATVSVGSVDHTFMGPREILRDALLANGSAIVVGHNHPSGDPEPSRDDEAVTRRIAEAGDVVGVEVLDHIVVGGSRWVSLARRGVL